MTEVYAITSLVPLLKFLFVCLDSSVFGVLEALAQLSRAQNWTQFVSTELRFSAETL